MEFLQLDEITIEILKDTEKILEGYDSRIFKAKVVQALGPGGQRKAERELEWNRKTIRKGLYELENDVCINRLSETGRKSSEYHLPNLPEDITATVKPSSQADPTFRTTQLYSPLTADEVRRRLIEDMGYNDEELPCVRTIRTKLNDMNCKPQKVEKTGPAKKIPQTDAIFDQVHSISKDADETEGVVRASIDAKAAINIGPFSRGGYNRSGIQASDHDFAPETVLRLFGVFLPAHDESFLYFTESSVTPDFMFDVPEDLWPETDRRFSPHTLVINSDNGPDNNSHRTQFVRRAVEFASEKGITVRLAYYPPYHSKYNPIERRWGILESHWNGTLLNTRETVLEWARSMTWKGIHPIVELRDRIYEKGIRITKKAFRPIEKRLKRDKEIPKYSVTIQPQLG